MTFKLIALDIDGTLLAPGVEHTAVPDPRMSAVIAGLIEADVAVVLATGRMFPGTSRIAAHLGVTQPLICQQGAATHALNGDVLHRCVLDQNIALDVVELARQDEWPYAWFDAERYLASTPNGASQHFADVSAVEIEYHDRPEDSGVIASGVDVISSLDHSTKIHNTLAQRYGDQIELLDFSFVTAVHSAQASKGQAVARLAQQLGIEQREVLAVGDSANDASMLNWAGHGAAPAHCDNYARNAADEVLAGDDVDGVVKLLGSVLAAT